MDRQLDTIVELLDKILKQLITVEFSIDQNTKVSVDHINYHANKQKEWAELLLKDEDMDKQIRKIEKETKTVEKDLKHLEKADKKRDKYVEAGKKCMKK